MINHIAKKILFSCFIAISLSSCAGTPTNESTGQYLDSSVITSKVKSQLLVTKNIDSTAINVTTYKDTVQLSGFVNTQAQKELAAQTAANVNGVNTVINNLVVKTP